MLSSEQVTTLKIKLCLIGEQRVGKTCLIRRFVLNEFDEEYMRTVGTLISKKSVAVRNEGRELRVDLIIWDIMGEKGFMELLQEAYFYKANGILAVADASRPETIRTLRDWIRSAQASAGPVPTLILGNKADALVDPKAREAEFNDLARLARCPYFLTSAKTGLNVERAFQELATAVATRKLAHYLGR